MPLVRIDLDDATPARRRMDDRVTTAAEYPPITDALVAADVRRNDIFVTPTENWYARPDSAAQA
jgi:hypothetical protein